MLKGIVSRKIREARVALKMRWVLGVFGVSEENLKL